MPVVLAIPEVPARSLATDFTALVTQAEAHVEQYPCDGLAWALLVPVYLQTGRHDDAAKARHHMLTLLATAIRTDKLAEVIKAYDVLLSGNPS